EAKARVVGQIEWKDFTEVFGPLFADEKVKKIGQNLKYDMQILRRHGIEVRGVHADTLLESYLLDPEQSHGLDALALKYLKHENIAYEDVTGKGKSQINFSQVDIEKAAEYAAEDADVTWRLHQLLFPEMQQAKQLESLFYEIEMPLVEVLS